MGGDWYMAPLMYFIGFFAVVTSCIILKKSELFAGDPAPFVMELPPVSLPSYEKPFPAHLGARSRLPSESRYRNLPVLRSHVVPGKLWRG